MAGHPIELPSIQFKSKKDATEFFRKMLNSYSDGDEINQLDDKYLFEVIQRHPEVKEKIGVGIKRFYREKSNFHPTSCFHLERYDGSTTDFSIPSCISSKEPTVEQGFYSACREAVSDKLILEKYEIFRNGNVKCFKTGEVVSIRESEYRHTTPRFRDIVRDFILENKIEVTKAILTESEDMQYATKFSNPNMVSKFIAFHSSLANLKIFKKYVH